MHSCGGRQLETFGQEGELIRFVGAKRQEAYLLQRLEQSSTAAAAAACYVGAGGSERRRQSASPAACKPQIVERMACNFRSHSVHVSSVISTPQSGRGPNTFPSESGPTDLMSNRPAATTTFQRDSLE